MEKVSDPFEVKTRNDGKAKTLSTFFTIQTNRNKIIDTQEPSRKQVSESPVPLWPQLRNNIVLFEPQKEVLPLQRKTKPYWISQKKPEYKKGSLAAVVDDVRNKLIEESKKTINHTMDKIEIDPLKNFKEKFNKYSDRWETMMNELLKQFDQIDLCYSSNNYFTYKKHFINDIINISISYILLGPDTDSGDGIDNIEGPYIILSKHRLSVSKRVQNYLNNLVPKTKNMNDIYQEVLKLDIKHNQLVEDKKLTEKLIKTLEINIKTQEKDIKANLDKDNINALKKNLEENRNSLKIAIEKNNNLQSDIDKNNMNIKNIKNEINKIYYSGFGKFVTFNYLMHNDYCPSLDYGLYSHFSPTDYPSFKNGLINI